MRFSLNIDLNTKGSCILTVRPREQSLPLHIPAAQYSLNPNVSHRDSPNPLHVIVAVPTGGLGITQGFALVLVLIV